MRRSGSLFLDRFRRSFVGYVSSSFSYRLRARACLIRSYFRSFTFTPLARGAIADFKAPSKKARHDLVVALRAAIDFARCPSVLKWREKVLSFALTAELKHNDEAEKARRAREERFNEATESAKAKFEARQRARQERLKELERRRARYGT